MATVRRKQIQTLEEGFIGQKRIVIPPNIPTSKSKSALIQQFYVTAIGYYPNARHHNMVRRKAIPDYIFIYCSTGQGYIEIAETRYELSANTFLIIPKETPHEYGSSDEHPWSIYWAHFNGNTAQTLYQRGLGKDNQLEVKPFSYNENYFQLFDETISILEHDLTTKELEVSNLNMLYLLSRCIYHKQINPTIYDTDNISQTIRFMKENLSSVFSLEELAKVAGISGSHYAMLFKKKMGIAPIQYFNQLKIQKSCQYLYFTGTSIKAICKELGFDDPYYFSRLFKKTMGISPFHYRKKHQADPK